MRRALLLAVFAAAACGSDEPRCSVVTNAGCVASLSCEDVDGRDEPVCLPPVVVSGKIVDATNGGVLAGARVTVYAEGGAALAAAGVALEDGSFHIRVHAPRDGSLKPRSTPIRLRAWATGYGGYPHRFHVVPALDLASARLTTDQDEWTVSSTDTQVALLPFTGGPGVSQVCGKLALARGAIAPLVVAAYGGGSEPVGAVSAVTDDAGEFLLIDLPPGPVTVTGYAQGSAWGPVRVDLNSGEKTCRDLPGAAVPVARVGGTLSLPAGATRPTVSLVVQGRYDAGKLLADEPPGLHAQAAADGSFSIAGVPPGRYLVVVSLDNDGLVQVDAPPTVEVGAADVTVAAPIRVAAALEVISPGANAPESITSSPTLSWKDAADEASYHVTVVTALGNVVSERTEPAHQGDAPTLPYLSLLSPGMPYRLRVEALDAQGKVLTRTEDQRGIFYQLR